MADSQNVFALACFVRALKKLIADGRWLTADSQNVFALARFVRARIYPFPKPAHFEGVA
jgi:hypothetical protein